MGEINDYRKDLKQRIIEYAMAEFCKRGVRSVKMDEISRGLHVSKRTVYEIFGDKEELLLEGLKETYRNMRVEMSRYACNKAHNVIDIIAFFYRKQMEASGRVGIAFYEEIHKMPRVLAFLESEHERDASERVRFFKEGVEQGLFREDLDAKMVLEMMHISMQEIMHRQLYRQYSMQEIFDNYIFVVIRGLCTERGMRMFNKAIER